MTGEHFWQTILAAKIPGGELYDLAKDLYFYRKSVSSGSAALTKLAAQLKQHPALVYGALNTDPGKNTLTKMGDDYKANHAWAQVSPETKHYLDRSAGRLTDLVARVEALKVDQQPKKSDPSRNMRNDAATRVREVLLRSRQGKSRRAEMVAALMLAEKYQFSAPEKELRGQIAKRWPDAITAAPDQSPAGDADALQPLTLPRLVQFSAVSDSVPIPSHQTPSASASSPTPSRGWTHVLGTGILIAAFAKLSYWLKTHRTQHHRA